jgi:hypothetical protein
MAHLNTTTSRILPRLADRLSARQAQRQTHARAPLRPEGTLFVAGGGRSRLWRDERRWYQKRGRHARPLSGPNVTGPVRRRDP